MRRGSRGLTLVEAVIASALMGTALLILASLFSAGTKAYNYALKQYLVTYNARRAIQGDGRRRGMVSSSLHAASAVSLSTGVLGVAFPTSDTAQYYVSGGRLVQNLSGAALEQAKSVAALEVHYYNFGSDGRVMESTSPASAIMATVQLTMSGGPNNAPVVFFSGGSMRNHP